MRALRRLASALGRLRGPITISTFRTLPGPPETVWDLLTDWEHQHDWMLEASDVAVTSPEREGVGVEAHATVRIAGIRMRDRIRVSGWDPPRRLEIRHLGWVKGRGVLELTPSGGGTRVDWREELVPPWGLVGFVGMLPFVPVMRRIFRRDLRVLEGLVRARSRAP